MKAMWLLLLPKLALAGPEAPPAPRPPGKPPVKAEPRVGFTADATAFVYTVQEELEAPAHGDDSDPEPCVATLEVVRDLASAKEVRYQRSSEGDDCRGVAALEGVRPAAAFEAWLTAHPLGAPPATKGPRGTTLVGLYRDCAALVCDPRGCDALADDSEKCQETRHGLGSVDLALKRADGRTYVLAPLAAGHGPMSMTTASVKAYWLPDESRVALVQLETSDGGRANYRNQTVTVTKFERVRVSVLARGSTDVVAEALRKLDGCFVSTGSPKDPRSATVVYAAPGFEADAARIARSVPGATVDKLSWKADADVVVALADK
jgi:hypothetical protein